MTHLPILKIELEGIKQQIASLLTAKSSEIDQIINEEIQQQITEEWVVLEIRQAVRDLLKSSIRDLANNYRLQTHITTLLEEALIKSLKEN